MFTSAARVLIYLPFQLCSHFPRTQVKGWDHHSLSQLTFEYGDDGEFRLCSSNKSNMRVWGDPSSDSEHLHRLIKQAVLEEIICTWDFPATWSMDFFRWLRINGKALTAPWPNRLRQMNPICRTGLAASVAGWPHTLSPLRSLKERPWGAVADIGDVTKMKGNA